MENKETKNRQAEELNDEALDEVTGGVYQFRDLPSAGSATARKSAQVKTPKSGAGASIPTMPGGDDIRTF